MNVQLAGPMQGLPDWNYPAFHAAAEVLKAAGHEVFNPAESGGGDTTLPRAYYMRAAIGALLKAELVVCLPGWEASRGAQVEVSVARALGLLVVDYDRLMSAPPEPPDGPDD